MADLRDFTKKNTVFVGTDGIRLPSGNSAQRVASANVDATLRYNTDIGGMEVYSPNGWTPLAAPPSISTVSPSTFSGESGTSFEIQGTNINPDAQVYFVTSNGATLLAATITYFGSSQIRATTPRNISVAEEPLSVRLVQQSGTVTKLNCIDAGGHPDWVTTAGTLGSIFGANTVNVYVTATDPENTAVTYQLSTGSLPGGLNFTTSNGLIQGVASSVLANTTYNFTIRATDTVNNNTDRSFSYTVLNRAPVINTAAGSLGTVYSGNATSASISAYDPDGGNLTYAVASGSLPTNSSLGTANGVIQGTPIVVTTNTTYTFSISATDEGSLTASNTYTYTVLNRPPLWNTAATLGSYSPETFTPITVNAYDPDGGSITYSLTSGSVPSGLTFVSANATITGTAPEVTDNTTSTFTVTATDPGSDANTRTFSLTITPIIDAQFSNTILLLKNSGNTVIRDASANNLPLTVVGDARASNFSPFNTSWSTYFGTSTSDNIIAASNAAYAIGTGNFTLEFFLNSTNWSGNQRFFLQGQSGSSPLEINRNSGSDVLNCIIAGSTVISYTWTPTLHTWNHIAFVRSGTGSSQCTLFINGVAVATGTSSGSITQNQAIIGGLNWATSYGTLGYISNFRYSNNVRYTGSFTPSTSYFQSDANTLLLTCQDNRFVDKSSYSNTITINGTPKISGWSPFAETDTTTGSIYFDGTGDYISNLPSDLLDFGSSEEFSIEFFAYFNSVPNNFGMLGLNAGIQQGYCITYDVNGGHYLLSGKTDEIGSASLLRTQSAGTLYPYKWHHICFARRSGVMSIYLDGVRVATRSSDTTTYASGAATVGYAGQGSATAMNGFMSNLRILTGSSAYDTSQTTLTVPTSPVSNISGTRLLTFQNRLPHNNHGFQDSSRNKNLITRNGNATQGTFSPFSADPGKWSNYFNGSSGVRFADNAAFQFGANAFTVEGWFNVASAPSNDASIISKWVAANDGNSSWMIDFQSSNLSAAISIGGSVTRITGSSGLPLGVWNHFALVRSGSPGTLSLFLNGNRIATATPTGSLVDDSNPVGIGVRGGTDSYYLTGYLTNIRVVNGTALYDPTLTTHVIPTGPLSVVTNTKLLTCQNNQFIDNSTANSGAGFTATALSTPFVQPYSPFAPNSAYTTANTGGSLYLDGSGDYLLTPSVQNLAFRSGQFTIEAWHYGTTTSGGGHIVSSRSGSVNDASTITAYVTGGNYSFYGNGNHVSASYVTGQWNHVVYTRDASNTLRIFINGILRNYEDSFTPDITATTAAIGSLTNGGEIIPACWISDIRLVTGYIPTSYQTSSKTNGTQIFTPPTAPLTTSSQGALPNTVTMLMNFTDAAIIDVTGKNIIETSSAARANNTAYKFSPGSMSFDASSSTRLQIPSGSAPPLFNFGTSDHTVEGWLNAFSSSSQMCMFDFRSSDTSGQGVGIFYSTSRTIFIYMQGNRITSSVLTNGTWYHVAVVRASNVYTLYVNGVSQGTWANSDAVAPPANRPYIGAVSDGSQVFDGLIQDVRVSRGARYTANFIPPTRSFPNR